jgi:hypothetical protein
MKKPLTPATAKFFALGVLSPSKREKSQQDVVELETHERSKDVNVVVKQKRGLVQRLKNLGIVLLLGIFLAACSSAASPKEELESQAKIVVPHYPLNGRLHYLDPELHWELWKISVQNGGTGSPQEIDELYHKLGHGH